MWQDNWESDNWLQGGYLLFIYFSPDWLLRALLESGLVHLVWQWSAFSCFLGKIEKQRSVYFQGYNFPHLHLFLYLISELFVIAASLINLLIYN